MTKIFHSLHYVGQANLTSWTYTSVFGALIAIEKSFRSLSPTPAARPCAGSVFFIILSSPFSRLGSFLRRPHSILQGPSWESRLISQCGFYVSHTLCRLIITFWETWFKNIVPGGVVEEIPTVNILDLLYSKIITRAITFPLTLYTFYISTSSSSCPISQLILHRSTCQVCWIIKPKPKYKNLETNKLLVASNFTRF